MEQLIVRLQDGITTHEKSNDSGMRWVEILRQLAQDKRHDLAPGILSYWRIKTAGYRDEEICEGLMLYRGQFFPSIDEILETVDRLRERRAEERAARKPKFNADEVRSRKEWEEYKFRNGLAPDLSYQEHWVTEHREEIRALQEKISMANAVVEKRRAELRRARSSARSATSSPRSASSGSGSTPQLLALMEGSSGRTH